MLSIRESITDLERIDELHNASLECYHSALQATAQYAVGFDDGATEGTHYDGFVRLPRTPFH